MLTVKHYTQEGGETINLARETHTMQPLGGTPEHGMLTVTSPDHRKWGIIGGQVTVLNDHGAVVSEYDFRTAAERGF